MQCLGNQYKKSTVLHNVGEMILHLDFTFSFSLGSTWVWVATEADDVAMKQGGFIDIAWFRWKIVLHENCKQPGLGNTVHIHLSSFHSLLG